MTEKKSNNIWEFAKTILWAVLIATVVRTTSYEPFNIPSGSMIPTLLVGDYIFVSKFSYVLPFSKFSESSDPGIPPFVYACRRIPKGAPFRN